MLIIHWSSATQYTIRRKVENSAESGERKCLNQNTISTEYLNTRFPGSWYLPCCVPVKMYSFLEKGFCKNSSDLIDTQNV